MIRKIDKRDETMNLIVQKSKPLFGLWASHLTLNGAKLLDIYIAKINSHDETTRMVTFYKSELEEILEMGRIKASDLKPVLDHLMEKFAMAVIIDGRKHYVLVNLFDIAHMEYDENGVTMVRMHCSEVAKKYFFNVENQKYISYDLKKITPLKSMYTYNMFLLLQFFRWNKHFKLTLSKLRERLGVVKSKEIDPLNKDKNVFQEFKRLNDQVLKVTQEELAERVDFKFTYELVKTGKNVASVIFHLDLPEQENKKPTKQKAKVANNKQTLSPPPSNPNPSCQEATKAKNEKSVETKKWNRKGRPIAAFEYKKLDFDIRKLINRREDENFDDCDEFKEKLRV